MKGVFMFLKEDNPFSRLCEENRCCYSSQAPTNNRYIVIVLSQIAGLFTDDKQLDIEMPTSTPGYAGQGHILTVNPPVLLY